MSDILPRISPNGPLFLYSFFHSGFIIEVYMVYDPDIILVFFLYHHALLSYGFYYISNSFKNTKWGAIYGPQQAEGRFK